MRERYEVDRFVGFVDILGFKDLTARAHKSPELRDDIVRALRRAREAHSVGGDGDLALQYFSDSIILTSACSAAGLWQLLSSIDQITWGLLNLDVWIRGGVALGGAYVADDVVFGPGINEAYRLENTIAVYPRTIVNAAVLGKAQEFAKIEHWAQTYLDTMLRRDDDGVWRLDFLRDYAARNHQYDKTQEVPAEDRVLLEQGVGIRDRLQARLDSIVDAPDVYAKAKWMAQYWNRTVVGNRFETQLYLRSVTMDGRPAR